METIQSARMDAKKNCIESMSKEELINKYKGLLGIAKQAKKAKDEFAEENLKLKEKLTNCETQREADKQSLLTMKEMLEEFTRNKLEMTSELSELRGKEKQLMGERANMEQLSIENEALRRQLGRLTEDNESLLTDIDNMELQLRQVNILGLEQKKHLDLLELEVGKLKDYELISRELETKLQNLLQANTSLQEAYDISQAESQTLANKYQSLKNINSEQRAKFNGLKDRFIEVHKKLKPLQDCKRILVESHHEYADSISRWQLEIMHASDQLCQHIKTLTKENSELKKEIQVASGDVNITLPQLPVLIEYCEKALVEYHRQNEVIEELRKENVELRQNLVVKGVCNEGVKVLKTATENKKSQTRVDTRKETAANKSVVKQLQADNARLVQEIEQIKLQADESFRQLAGETARLKEEPEEASLSAAGEELNCLKMENARLEEQAAKSIRNADELDHLAMQNAELRTENVNLREELQVEIMQLRTENRRLEELISKSKNTEHEESNCLREEVKLTPHEDVNQLGVQNPNMNEELVNFKLRSDNEKQRLMAENENANTTEIDQLKSTNQGLKDQLLAITSASNENIALSYLPILINCCDRALLEHKQQTQALENLNQQTISSGRLYTDTEATLQKELNTIRSENDRLKAEQSNLYATAQLCEDLQSKLDKQERENTDLLNEMRELNEALKGRGDVISRQQAKHQELVAEVKKTSTNLVKIEVDLNAKDAKLKEKNIKITKMSEDNNAALQEVNRLQNVCRDQESRIKTLSEEISAMRSQLENHDTQSEVLSTSTTSRAEELVRLREVDESFEEKYNKLRSFAVKLKKKVHEQSLHIADLEKLSGDTKAQSERITSLENERESLQKELKTCKSRIESLKTEVDKLKTSKKQSNVLNLEIEAFEKSLNETTARLMAKITEYDLLRETLQSKESSIEVMKKEIKILEDSQESEKMHSAELKKQIDNLQAQVKDVIHAKQGVSGKLDESQAEKQSLQSDLEEINRRLLSISNGHDAERGALLNEKEILLRTINSLEDELHSSNNRITIAERSYKDLQQEYSNYKVKAQSVLRQNQTKESSKERELEEELILLKAEHKDLSLHLQTFHEKAQANEKHIEELQEENRRLQNRSSELINTISDLRTHTDHLAQENKKQLDTYQETLKGHRQQIEAINACHLTQMQDLQAKYDREVAELKAVHKKNSETMPPKPLEKLDYILMEREDAEGSEAETTNTPKYLQSTRRSTHDLIPLDELLSSPTVDSTYTILERRQSISPSIELQETKERLLKQESRVRHLTSLLAESEQDLARLTQLNEMLKEEVRRQERTVEREKHMHNSEYLKNVVLKFVSLNNGDERTRLVPVLNTILKLSPTETEMLQNVAKGKALDNNNRNWGSFLPHWGGTS